MLKTLLKTILIYSFIIAQEPYDIERFVSRYLIFHQSKMNFNPVVWQELKEGHLRSKAIFYGELVQDSLQARVPALDIAVRKFQYLTDLRWDVYDSEDYSLKVEQKVHNANYNYFSTSLD